MDESLVSRVTFLACVGELTPAEKAEALGLLPRIAAALESAQAEIDELADEVFFLQDLDDIGDVDDDDDDDGPEPDGKPAEQSGGRPEPR